MSFDKVLKMTERGNRSFNLHGLKGSPPQGCADRLDCHRHTEWYEVHMQTIYAFLIDGSDVLLETGGAQARWKVDGGEWNSAADAATALQEAKVAQASRPRSISRTFDTPVGLVTLVTDLSGSAFEAFIEPTDGLRNASYADAVDWVKGLGISPAESSRMVAFLRAHPWPLV